MDPAVALEVAAMSRQRAADDAAARGDSDVQRWYSGATALLTGGSGFLGKQLVEKLLRSCNLKKVYLVLRTKKGKAPNDRLAEVLADPVFDKVRKMYPDFASKIEVVGGDVMELRLGLNDYDWRKVTKEVNVIFHVAATTRFNDPLKLATLTNVRGTREALLLGKDCKNLRSFVHVSTAFCHATNAKLNARVLEKFYSSPVPPALMIDMAENIEEATLNAMTPQLLRGEWINTYTFTKVIAEEAVRQAGRELPICIVRPSIVISTYCEPTPGWLDLSCAYGPTGVLLGVGVGVIHVNIADDDTRIDLVPVDLVNNAIVAAAWQTARAQDTEPTIYTVTATRHPVIWKEICSMMITSVRNSIPTPKAVWFPGAVSTNNRVVYLILYWLFHYIPAYIVDGVCFVIGKKVRAVHMFTKAYKMFITLSPFTLKHWDFDDANLQDLQRRLSPTDRQIFNFDTTTVDWMQFMALWAMGSRKYLVKDGLKDTDYALKKQYWLRILHYAFVVLYAYLLFSLLYYAFSVTKYVFSFVF